MSRRTHRQKRLTRNAKSLEDFSQYIQSSPLPLPISPYLAESSWGNSPIWRRNPGRIDMHAYHLLTQEMRIDQTLANSIQPRRGAELPPPPRIMTFQEIQEEIRRDGNGMTTGQVEDLLQGHPARVAMNEIRIVKNQLLFIIDSMDAVNMTFTDLCYRASNLRERLENMESRLRASSTAPSPAPSQNENENN